MDNNISDDGSLACLNIPEDKSNKHFNCPEITQQKLINLTFWIIDYLRWRLAASISWDMCFTIRTSVSGRA